VYSKRLRRRGAPGRPRDGRGRSACRSTVTVTVDRSVDRA